MNLLKDVEMTICFGCKEETDKVFQWRTAQYCKDCTIWLIDEKGWR